MKTILPPSNAVSARVTVAGFVGGIALVLSTALSGSGIYFSLAESAMTDAARLCISAVSTLFLTLLAFQFWLQAGRRSRERFLRRAQPALPRPRAWRHVLAGLVMTSMSVLTATTALLFLNNREVVQALLNRSAFAATIDPVATMADGMALIASTAARADAVAAARSQREAAFGGTCGESAPGAGPLTRMRAEHAKAAESIAQRAAALHSEASAVTRMLVAAEDQAMVNEQFAAARAVRNSPTRQSIARGADALSVGYGGAGFFFENRQRKCHDPELAALFAGIATTALAVDDLPTQPPLRREAKIFDAFAIMVPVLMNGDQGRDVGMTQASIMPFVLFAALIDLVSLGGAFGHGTRSAQRMSNGERQQLHRTAWLLRNFVWNFPVVPVDDLDEADINEKCQAFVFVPLGGNPERTRQAEYLAALFDLSVDPAFQFEPLVARRREFEPWVEQMRLASGNATHYAVYPIREQAIYDRIMGMKRDALRALALSKVDGWDFPELGHEEHDRVVPLRAV